ncbi:hypothetical protein [Tellurirhabdus bombi]|uniref:hypothetical protein n=1 Tax=Tellurirhabdus bombi TaxID=2907205 RepID=UPI001F33B729|nr:hypothetical protein [Tellurirhabdus bombi]
MQNESKAERIARRRKEREDKMKATPGYKVWSVAFTIMYPFVAVFTALFTGLLSVFSTISNAFVWMLSGGKSNEH